MPPFSPEALVKITFFFPLKFLLLGYISSSVPDEGCFSHGQGSITWPMKRTVPEKGRHVGDENREKRHGSPSPMFMDEPRCENVSELSGVTAAVVTKLGLGSWHRAPLVTEHPP